jgi:hypothetical protein
MSHFSQLDIQFQNHTLLHNIVLTELIEFLRNKLKEEEEEEELERQIENYHQYLFDVARGK